MRFCDPLRKRASPAILLAITLSSLSAVSADTGLPTLTATSDDAEPTGTGTATTGGSTAASTKASAAASTTGGSSAAASSSGSLPGLSSSSAAVPSLTDLPTLSGAYNYPSPTVPPTANAPYMQKSNLPEGTVFICVGAALAFVGLVMVAWRLVTRWIINRSVKKAAMSQYTTDTKAMMDTDRKSKFYSHSPDSSLSMERLTKTGRPMSSLPKQPASNASLFFSPTAGAGMHTMGNRNSSGYLPAGYYSVGNAAAGNGMPTTQIGGGRRPQSEAYTNAPSRYDDSPQDSPDLPPSRHAPMESMSNLSTNISATQGTRTPSNYLDDLMSIPPLPPPHQGNSRPSADYARR